ncbi:hypothetical protein CBR_g24170 [Chara braunii]|uniref:DDE Tnp4 domain-containing protein n=1 Tax=Chara braunii TaxID=69332 RepID=A0A388L5Y3_CHABU|nr:hypothetical protein CBR_g24168 [Chara braunii]GBG77723.1 hypothetical protein CBR_g24170 [Chara braunii]|eukprot:GBG77721.1 hypothetical protein CBR_g24168 [Chara braunii]
MDVRGGGLYGEECEDTMLMVAFFIIHWMNRRNAAAMAVVEAVSVMPFLSQNVSAAVALLAGGTLHGFALGALAAEKVGRRLDLRRRMWVVECSGGVWKDLQQVGAEHDKVFTRFCRLPRPLFLEVMDRISPHIQRSPTNFRLSIPASQKFACAMIRWATTGYYRQSSHGLGMGLASALRSNVEVADAIIAEYGHLLRFRTGQRLEDVLHGFERKGFPGCVGAIDCTHLYIEKPKGVQSECFYHHIGGVSVVAQFVCDHECQIVSVYVSCPGSVHDSRALRMSPLFENATAGKGVLGEGGAILHDGRHIGWYLIGDQGYPLLSWLMTPFGRFAKTAADRAFDESHSAARSCIERTFGLLKAVWRNFIRRHICNLATIMKEFMAVCILHNLVIERNVQIDPALMGDSSNSEGGDGGDSNLRRRRRRRRFHRHLADLNIEAVPFADPTYGGDLAKHAMESSVEHVRHHVAVHGAPPPCPWR